MRWHFFTAFTSNREFNLNASSTYSKLNKIEQKSCPGQYSLIVIMGFLGWGPRTQTSIGQTELGQGQGVQCDQAHSLDRISVVPLGRVHTWIGSVQSGAYQSFLLSFPSGPWSYIGLYSLTQNHTSVIGLFGLAYTHSSVCSISLIHCFWHG